jgi:hypothetical protein
VFDASVDGLCGAVAGAGKVEQREDVGSALLQSAAETANLDQGGVTPLLTASITPRIIYLALFLTGSR